MDMIGGYQRPDYRRMMRNNYQNSANTFNRMGNRMANDSCGCVPQINCERPRTCGGSMMGALPENCPIGMGYVPMQKFEDLYDQADALSQGTIFAQLNLPFVMTPCYGGRCRS